MKRLTVSLLALVTCIGVTFGHPSRAEALPPPCPAGQVFSFCVLECPINPTSFCMGKAGDPVHCRIVSESCDTDEACDYIFPYPPPGTHKWLQSCEFDNG
jgi:hypothetical protein